MSGCCKVAVVFFTSTLLIAVLMARGKGFFFFLVSRGQMPDWVSGLRFVAAINRVKP
jgi:hypothetical protein